MNDINTTGTCFTINSDNVTLDLNGYTITGDDNGNDNGIYSEGKKNLTIMNGSVMWFGKSTYNGKGVYLRSTTNSFIRDIRAVNNYLGISLYLSSYNNISNIYISSNVFGGLSLSQSNNNTISNVLSLGDNIPVNFYYSNNNSFYGFNSSNSSYGFYTHTSSNNRLYNFNISSEFSMGVWSYSSSNTYYNLNSSNSNLSFYSYNLVTNTLVYNNSYGQIVWNRNNLTTPGNLTFPGTIQIRNGSAYVNVSALSILNSSANITFYTSDYSGQYPIMLRKIGKNGVECGSSCYNFTALDASTVVFNVSDFGNGNVSVGKIVRSKSEIPLTTGWNMISIQTENNETSQDVNVSLSAGWNLIGYSSSANESTTGIDFVNDSGSKDDFVNSSKSGKVQRNIAYLTGSANAQKYSLVGKTGADANLTKNRGYWVYANQSGNLTMKGVGGSAKNDSYKLTDLMFRNGSGVEKNISDAVREGWTDGYMWYYSAGGYDLVQNYEDLDFCEASGYKCRLSSWDGYFVKGLKNNITMLRQN
ncbi:Uncharacterised protein [uncultured archaeon]|nr:Uncharacterised protein [uncultured archaeon]